METVKKWFIDKQLTERKELLEKLTISETYQDVITKIIQDTKPITPILLGTDVYRDIEFFENINSTQKNPTVFEKLDFHTLQGGKEVGKLIYSAPISSPKLLLERQKILKKLEGAEIPALEGEKDVLWLFEDVDENLETLYNMVYFRAKAFQPLNNYGKVLTGWNIYKILISPLVGILSPIIYFIIPFFVLKYKFKIPVSFKTYLKLIYATMMTQGFFGEIGKNVKMVKIASYIFSLIFYFQGLFNSVELSKTLYRMTKFLVNRVNNVVVFLKSAQALIEKLWDPAITRAFITNPLEIIPLQEEKTYIDSLKTCTWKNFGDQLHTYKNIDKDVVTSIMNRIYILDALISIIKCKKQYNLQYTNIVDSTKPVYHVQGVWHPCIDQDKAVCNTMNISDNQNAIITGSNAAGKSLFIKSLLVNALLSQTCTLSVALEACTLTPFAFINSQISIPDCTGFESLFQAEMHRCKYNLDTLSRLDKDTKALIIIDEIFNSTNPIEAIAGGYAICKKIADYENAMMVFTTHFNYLTKLSKRTNKFKNYRMETLIEGDNINFTYKLKEGVNRQFMALELLKKEGFDADIIDEAIAIKKRLT